MKKFNRVELEALRNETHVELNGNIVRLVEQYGVENLTGIELLFNAYKPLYLEEVALLDLIRKSEITVEIEAKDSARDNLFRGFVDAVKSAHKHFEEEKRQAAAQVQLALDHYGNLAIKTYDDESAAIEDMLREFAGGNYPQAIAALGLTEWLTRLEAENAAFKTLMAQRYTEASKRPTARMKTVRTETNNALRAMLNHVEALMMVNGEEKYAAFAAEVNAVMERYKNTLAAEQGRRAKKKEEE